MTKQRPLARWATLLLLAATVAVPAGMSEELQPNRLSDEVVAPGPGLPLDLLDGLAFSAGALEVDSEAPSTVVAGHPFRASLTISTRDAEVATLVEVFAHLPDAATNPCHAAGYAVDGGINLGGNLYMLMPRSNTIDEIEAVPSSYVTVTWKMVADAPGACVIRADVKNPLSSLAPGIIEMVTFIVPEISATQIDLGHLQSWGGMITNDVVRTVTPPASSEVVVQSFSTRPLAIASGLISHNDHMSYYDSGVFEITPPADPELLSLISDVAELKWTMPLTDTADSVSFAGVVQLTSTPEGFPTPVCLTGTYIDDHPNAGATPKGTKAHCVTVRGVQMEASFPAAPIEYEELARMLTEQYGAAFIPAGKPDVWLYMEDANNFEWK